MFQWEEEEDLYNRLSISPWKRIRRQAGQVFVSDDVFISFNNFEPSN